MAVRSQGGTASVGRGACGLGIEPRNYPYTGTQTAFAYDALGRLTVRHSGTAGQASYHADEFVFDGLGRMITAFVKTGSAPTTDSLVARLYDLAGRITAEYQAVGSGATRHVDYAYDPAGQMTRIRYPNGLNYYYYEYGDNGMVTHVYRPYGGGEYAEYRYVGRRLTKRLNTVSLHTAYEYDGLARLTRVRHSWYGGTYDDYAYGLDKADSRTYRENKVTSGMDELYSYDTLDRLTRSERGDLNEGYSAIDDLTRFQGYRLDQVGNWTRFYDDSATAETRLHNAVNEITKIDNSDAYVGHDAAGNMTRAPFAESYHSYEYDHLNRLTLVKDDGDDEVAKYAYDALGLRIEKIDVANSVTKHFYYGQTASDGSSWQLLDSYKNGGPYERFVWGAQYIDELVWLWRDTDGNGNWNYLLVGSQDGNWNVTGLLHYYFGTAVERYAYDPYGRVTVMDGDWVPREDNESVHDMPVLYGGYYHDAETGLYHVRNRYLHPTLGRWMQRDPIGYLAGLNLYESVDSSPTRWTDPLGLLTFKDFWEATQSGRDSWFREFLSKHWDSIDNAARKYCIPRNLLANVIAAEMISYGRSRALMDDLHIGGNVGLAQLELEEALEYKAIDPERFAYWYECNYSPYPNIRIPTRTLTPAERAAGLAGRLKNIEQVNDLVTEALMKKHGLDYLRTVEGNIDTAASLVRTYLDKMCMVSSTGKMSLDFANLVGCGSVKGTADSKKYCCRYEQNWKERDCDSIVRMKVPDCLAKAMTFVWDTDIDMIYRSGLADHSKSLVFAENASFLLAQLQTFLRRTWLPEWEAAKQAELRAYSPYIMKDPVLSGRAEWTWEDHMNNQLPWLDPRPSLRKE